MIKKLFLSLLAFSVLSTAVAAARPAKRLHTIRFPSSAAALSADEQAKLAQVAGQLKTGDIAAVRLIGHTDRHGSATLNQRLGLRRAQVVARRLAALGVAQDRIIVESAGMTQPLDPEPTAAADARNRRVEVWVATRDRPPTGPPARVSWIWRDVQTKSVAAPLWTAARLEQPLEVLDRVRTLELSAAEITFRNLDRLRLGSQALLVINRPPPDSPPMAAVADVQLQEGTLLARLADPRRRLSLTSPAAEVALESSRSRIGHDRRKKASTVSVYDGRADVSAQGESVRVEGGFGTRVREGRRPEPPAELPPAPTWMDAAPLVTMGGSPAKQRLRHAGTATVAVVEILRHEAGTDHLIRTLRAANAIQLPAFEPGVYSMLVRGQDARGLVGDHGPPRPLVILPRPVSTFGANAATSDIADGEVLRLTSPDTVRVTIPAGLDFESPVGTYEGGVWSIPVEQPGHLQAPFTLTDRNRSWRGTGQLTIILDPPPAVAAAPPPPIAGPKPGLSVLAGAALPFERDAAPAVLGSYSWPIPLRPDVHARWGPELGWTQVEDRGRRLQLIPTRLRLSLDFDLRQDRLYFGGAGGLMFAAGRLETGREGRLESVSLVHPTLRAFVGLGQAVTDDTEAYIEFGASWLRILGDRNVDDGRFLVLVGARWLAR